MSLSKLTDNLNIVSGLENQPTITAAELKAKFDEAAGLIKTYLNSVLTEEIDSLFSGLDAADIDYDDSETSLSATNTQDAIKALKTLIDGLSFTAQAISYSKTISGTSVTNVKAALDKLVSNDSTNSTNIGKKTTYDDFVVTSHNSGTISNGNGGAAVKTINITKSGYYPLGIVGYTSKSTNHYNNTEMEPCITHIYLSARNNGSGTIYGRTFVSNNSAWTYSSEFTAYVLWVKVK